MSVYAFITMFGVVVAVMKTPYTMDQCLASFEKANMKLYPELQAGAGCSWSQPMIGKLTVEQQKIVDDMTAKMDKGELEYDRDRHAYSHLIKKTEPPTRE